MIVRQLADIEAVMARAGTFRQDRSNHRGIDHAAAIVQGCLDACDALDEDQLRRLLEYGRTWPRGQVRIDSLAVMARKLGAWKRWRWRGWTRTRRSERGPRSRRRVVRARHSFDMTKERLTAPMGPDRWLSSTRESSWWTFGPTSQTETEPTFPKAFSRRPTLATRGA